MEATADASSTAATSIKRGTMTLEEGAGSVAVNRRVKIGATAKLYDADGGPDSDGLLGAEIVGADSGSLSFTNDDAAIGRSTNRASISSSDPTEVAP